MCLDWLAAELSWLPILVGLLLLCGILISYCIAVSLNHVTVGLPFISDTGTIPPESCVFGQLLNMTAAAAFAWIFIRYKQVHVASEGNPKVCRLNGIGLVLGMLACLGMSLAANFQETNALAVHSIGAIMCFGLGSIYEVVHTWITFRGHSHGLKTYFRLLLSVCSIILFILTFTFTSKALAAHKGAPDPLIWHPDDEGYTQHQVATISEWLMAISFLLFFWTYIPEFRWLRITVEVCHGYRRIPGADSSSQQQLTPEL